MEGQTRIEFRDQLANLEERGLDGLNLVTVALDRTIESIALEEKESKNGHLVEQAAR